MGRTDQGGVLIVGAGPTGLTLAIELQRRGVPHRIVERNATPHMQSRATDMQSRTLEIFDDLGLAQAMIAAGKIRRTMTLYLNGRAAVTMGYEGMETDFPYCLGIAQHLTEKTLSDHLESLGGTVERGVRLAYLKQGDRGVHAVLLYPDGTWDEPRFDWVVGCDGAHSVVRHAMGVPFSGRTYEETFFLVDLTLNSPFPEDQTTMFSSEFGMCGLLPLAGAGRMRVFGDLDPGFDGRLDESTCNDIILPRIGHGATISDIGWTSVFRIHSRQVSEYRKGRILLAGDAAHVHSPAGGHGMNVGIHDAHNLGWKLALVWKRLADDTLLDSYHHERWPVARSVLNETDMETRMSLWRGRFAQGAIGMAMKVATGVPRFRQRVLESAMELAVNYRNSPIVGEHRTSLLGAHITHDLNSEAPSIADVREFSAAPRPGDRAPNVPLDGGSLYKRLRGTTYDLLLFDGMSPTAEGYENLAEIAAVMRSRWGDLIRTHVVIPSTQIPAPLASGAVEVIPDPDRVLHARYGAGSECLYLIRPDSHVGFRAQPAVLEPLVAHLEGQLLGGIKTVGTAMGRLAIGH